MLIKNLFYDTTMDCYQLNGGDDSASYPVPTLSDMIDAEMDIDMFQQHDTNKQQSLLSYTATTALDMTQDGYSINSPHHIPSNYSADGHIQEYRHKFPSCTLPTKSAGPDDGLPISHVNWLQSTTNGLHQDIGNPSRIINPPSPIIANGNQSVHNQSLSSKLLSLPNSVQISGGNVNYVSMPSSTQQVYITTSKTCMATHQQPPAPPGPPAADSYRSRSDSCGSYMLSPSSTPSSTVADNPFPKPAYSYSCLIALALKNSQHGSLPVAEIYNFMIRHFPYFKTAPDGWKNSVRHNLSLNKCFEKIENPNSDGTNSRKGCLWALNPAKIKKMDEEVFKWNKKDPMAIKRAMARPEILDILAKGQESYLTGNGPKRVSGQGRQPILPSLHQHQAVVHQLHQPHSPHHSPTMNGPSPMLTQCVSANGHHSVAPSPLNSTGGMPSPAHSILDHQQPNIDRHLNKHHLAGEVDMYSGNDFSLDPALTEISIQSGMFDDLPNNFLDIPFTSSPTFQISPKRTSPALSPAARSAEPPALNGIPRGTLITLGQN